MSSTSLINWFEQLLFGHTCVVEPPCLLFKLIARLEAEGIHWKDMIGQGGLTLFRYQAQGDLDKALDYLEHQTETLPTFKTRCVTAFFNQLLAFLARRDSTKPIPYKDDKMTLETILQDSGASVSYVSADFWGDLARQWLTHRRPIPKTLAPLPHPSSIQMQKMARLYDITCQTRGENIDPLAMHVVPASEYVNAVHWQSGSLLASFIHSRPQHALSTAVQQVVLEALNEFLAGHYPSCLEEKDDKVMNFLQNVSVTHDTVPQVLTTPAPKVIDVFHRLLAMAQLDDLWITVPKEPESRQATQVMQLTEQLLLAERQNTILLKHIGCQ